jgi:hypothetical protein
LTSQWLSDKIRVIMTTPSTTPTVPTATATATPVEKSPIVEFEYPDSTTGEMKVRYLRVVEADARYVKGYELVTPLSKVDGQFKSFLRTRLARNGVSLVSF